MASNWSEREERQLQQLLAKKAMVASDGLKGTASDGSPTSPQSMTDASKRRLTDEGWEAVIEENYVFSSLTPPPYPQAGSSHGREFENDLAEFPLPAGVRSMEEWGKTLFTFGSHKAAGASYEEVAANPEKRDYVKWSLSHLKTSSGGPQDWFRYLRNRQVQDRRGGSVIEGTDMVRVPKK